MIREERLIDHIHKIKLLCRLYNALEPMKLHLEYDGNPLRIGDAVWMTNGDVIYLKNAVQVDLDEEAHIYRVIFGSIPFNEVRGVVIALDSTKSNFIFGWV